MILFTIFAIITQLTIESSPRSESLVSMKILAMFPSCWFLFSDLFNFFLIIHTQFPVIQRCYSPRKRVHNYATYAGSLAEWKNYQFFSYAPKKPHFNNIFFLDCFIYFVSIYLNKYTTLMKEKFEIIIFPCRHCRCRAKKLYEEMSNRTTELYFTGSFSGPWI